MNLTVKIRAYGSATEITVSEILKLTFEKERYTPYTKLTVSFVSGSENSEIISVKAICDTKTIHYGPVDTCETILRNGCRITTIVSRGFSGGLGVNQPTPEINYNVNLESLLANNISIPHVTCETGTPTINYIFVKENSTLWDAVAALCRKTNSGYPHIYEHNTVRLSRSPSAKSIILASSDIISCGNGNDLSKMLSHIHMKDINGTYNTYNLTNSYAVQREIVRHKQVPFDRQWLATPETSLEYRRDFSMRGCLYKKLSYYGYNGEDLRDYVSAEAPNFSVVNREISRIRLTADLSGIVTTLWMYTDNYTP